MRHYLGKIFFGALLTIWAASVIGIVGGFLCLFLPDDYSAEAAHFGPALGIVWVTASVVLLVTGYAYAYVPERARHRR